MHFSFDMQRSEARSQVLQYKVELSVESVQFIVKLLLWELPAGGLGHFYFKLFIIYGRVGSA